MNEWIYTGIARYTGQVPLTHSHREAGSHDRRSVNRTTVPRFASCFQREYAVTYVTAIH